MIRRAQLNAYLDEMTDADLVHMIAYAILLKQCRALGVEAPKPSEL